MYWELWAEWAWASVIYVGGRERLVYSAQGHEDHHLDLSSVTLPPAHVFMLVWSVFVQWEEGWVYAPLSVCKKWIQALGSHLRTSINQYSLTPAFFFGGGDLSYILLNICAELAC